MLATGSEWEFCQELGYWGSLECSLPVVTWDFNGFFKNWDDRGSLERSLPVVNWDLNDFFQKNWADRRPLERSLP